MERDPPRSNGYNRHDAPRMSQDGGGRRSGGAGADHHPRSALGREGAVAPSERIVLGGIGIGSRGEFDLSWMLPEKDVQFVAICDVRKERREHVKKLVDKKYGNSDCKMYPEMREFLATRPDIDALLIATGDRWHAHGDDHGDAGRQGRLLREAVVHDHRRGPGGGGDGPPLRPHLPDRHPAAQRGQLRRRHRDGPHRPAGQGPHGPRPHRPLGRGRDEPRLAARGAAAAQGRGRLGRLARPLPLAALQLGLRPRAAGAVTTTSTPAASASGARTPSPSPRRASTR